MMTNPSVAKTRRASRTGMRETPSSADRWASTRRSPGAYFPVRMRLRIESTTSLASGECAAPMFSARASAVMCVAPIELVRADAVYNILTSRLLKGKQAMVYRVVVLQTSQSFEVNQNESVLEAALRQEVKLAHECTFGGCGTCRVKLVEGAVGYEQFPVALT